MQLKDCTLFPHGGLPLNIFEPRYREMLADSLEGDCIFAIAHVHDDGETETVSPIGTAALIRASKEREDGSSELLLHGIVRVRFVEWLSEKSYPCAVIEPLLPEPMEPETAAAALKILKGSLEDCIAGLSAEFRNFLTSLISQADEPSLLADLISHQFVQAPDLRQKLLETPSIGERISLLCKILRELDLNY